MAYVRVRGNQLAIVHGVRDPKTSKVEQQILFTLYSKPEALDAIGRGESGADHRFKVLLDRQYPGIAFDWKAIRRRIAENLDALPDSYEHGDARLRGEFGRDLRAFAKQLLVTDPQDLVSAAEVINTHRRELQYVRNLIDWRLHFRKLPEKNEWNSDNRYFWRYALPGARVPVEAEEQASVLFDKGDYDHAEAAFRVLVDCFDDYADGHNYLGRIAVERGRLEHSLEHFQRAIETGRRLFPRQIGRKRYWSDHATRPYMRGLYNMAISLNRLDRQDEALAFCEQIESECGDRDGADAHRAAIFLNMDRWAPAAEAANRLCRIFPDMSLTAALAFREMGSPHRALASFIHGALNRPRSWRMILGERTAGVPKGHDEVTDHNQGVSLTRDLGGYLRRHGKAASRFFLPLLRAKPIADLIAEREVAVRRWFVERGDDRRDFDRLHVLQSYEFAGAKAAELGHLVGVAPPRPAGRSSPTRLLN